jgi:hypothetical protein
VDSLSSWNSPEWDTGVVLLEFRNDFCSDNTWRKNQVKILTEVINQLKEST